MVLDGPFRVEGVIYSYTELLETCRLLKSDRRRPRWERDIYIFIENFLDQSNTPLPQRTSGTTGPPVEYELSREAMVHSAFKTLEFFGLEPGDSALLCLPVDYIAGKMMVVRALAGGLDLINVKPSGRPLEKVDRKIDFAAMVPLQVHESVRMGDDLTQIEKLIIGGGEIHPALREKISGLTSTDIYESFAMTETYTHFALKRINGTNLDPGFRLLDGVTIRTDERGCLMVNFKGVTPGEILTNDMVELLEEGDCFRWLGRYDNVISTGGIKIVPEELEIRIGNILGISCLVVPEPDEKLGSKLVLIIEITDGEPDADAMIQRLRSSFPPHEVPKRMVFVNEIPRNNSFKPDRILARKLI